MNKGEKMMMMMLSEQINFYSDAMARARSLHEFAVHARDDKLAVATQRAVDGLGELVNHFSLQQDAIMGRNGAVHVPIKTDRKHYEIYFKGIHTKGNPLW